ncbi:MAG TPA: shikimate kinase [Thermohalobaculum sp.]|nr:shikimate kinase [Thermohalobaculum sp.]
MPQPAADRKSARRLARPVVLIGLMGAGKTSVGTRLAELLGAPFRDSDAEIERAAALTVPEIFARYGEAHFRDGERRVIGRLLGEGAQVLATGGGAFMTPETRALIAERATSVWLRASLDLLAQRTHGRGHRPLLNRGNPRDTLARLIDERYPVYALADIRVDSLPGLSHEQMARRILAALEAHGGALEREPR